MLLRSNVGCIIPNTVRISRWLFGGGTNDAQLTGRPASTLVEPVAALGGDGPGWRPVEWLDRDSPRPIGRAGARARRTGGATCPSARTHRIGGSSGCGQGQPGSRQTVRGSGASEGDHRRLLPARGNRRPGAAPLHVGPAQADGDLAERRGEEPLSAHGARPARRVDPCRAGDPHRRRFAVVPDGSRVSRARNQGSRSPDRRLRNHPRLLFRP